MNLLPEKNSPPCSSTRLNRVRAVWPKLIYDQYLLYLRTQENTRAADIKSAPLFSSVLKNGVNDKILLRILLVYSNAYYKRDPLKKLNEKVMTKAVNQPKKEKSPKYFNRELSWLAFNRRVLEQAKYSKYPLLERLRYLSFVSSNLDEFYEIRVSGLIQQADSGVMDLSIDGMTPRQQLKIVHEVTERLVKDQYACWSRQIVPSLKKNGIIFKTRDELTKSELAWLKHFFHDNVFPVLTPLAIDLAHPFPQLINKGLNILVWLEDTTSGERDYCMAVIPVPRILPRVIEIRLKGKKRLPRSYIFLSDLLTGFSDELFPGYKHVGAWEFRITRNSDLYIDPEEVENLLKKIEEELYNIRRGSAVRLEIRKDIEKQPLKRLLKAINLSEENVFPISGPLNLWRLMSVYDLVNKEELKFKKFQAYVPPPLSIPQNIFNNIKNEDILLHHPYDSFGPVLDFVQQAAVDPQVFAIKQAIYRTTGGDDSILEALKEASRNGKQVTALIELTARFDEANNIQWAKELEEEGVHVVYGVIGRKIHCKCCLVVRREKKELRRYVHLGTGNYNPKTARLYTDFAFFTACPDITEEVASLFNTLTGFGQSPPFKKLLVAPFNLYTRMQELITREINYAKKGKPARIFAKLNSLVDQDMIDHLYKASQAGVTVDLLVRGICSLIPKVKGLSENITVRSILGRYLEHSRIYYFENGDKDSEIYLGSADWMPRNFFRRIETVFPIESKKLKKRLEDIILVYWSDDAFAQELTSIGEYLPRTKNKSAKGHSCQKYFMDQADRLRQMAETMHGEEKE